MKIHHLPLNEVFVTVQSTPEGLASAEAQRRLAEFGRNEVARVEREPLILTFFKEFGHFFAIILWVAAALAFIAEWRDSGQGMAALGFAIIGVVIVNGLFSFWQTYHAEQALAALQKLLPRSTKTMRDGSTERISATELVPGDVILLESGDNVPADCRLVEAFGVRVNNATITGESLPQSRYAEACDEAELLCARNILLAGTSLVSGEARAVVFATGKHSAFWTNRASHTEHKRGELAAAKGDHAGEPLRCTVGHDTGRGVLHYRPRYCTTLLGEFRLCHRHHCRACARGAAAGGDARARHRFAAHGTAKRTHPSSACCRDAWLHHGHLHGQDGHADAEPHGGPAALYRRRDAQPVSCCPRGAALAAPEVF
jgi:E1-E2 ATPase/Cation transporter/ATPase, N-terminus